MAITIPGLSSEDNVSRVDRGEGHVRERTFDVGDTVISVNNIGSMMLIEQRQAQLPGLIGALVAVLGVIQLRSSVVSGVLLAAAGGGFALWWFSRKLDVFLSIGTSDGRRTNIVSKNKQFLERVREVLRQKIDTPNVRVIGTVNLSQSSVNVSTQGGAVSFGSQSIATGRDGSVTLAPTSAPENV